MKIKQVIPITDGLLTDDKSLAFIRKYLNDGTIVETSQIKNGRASIEGEYDETVNAPEVVKLCVEADTEGCDGMFIDCFGDPGVRAAREAVAKPIFGGFEPAMLVALGLGDKIGIVTVLKNVIPLINGAISRNHFTDRVACVRAIEMPVLELENHELMCEKITYESVEAIEKDGAEVIVLGCTGIIDVADTVKAKLNEKGYDVPVVEPAQAALNMIEMYSKMGLYPSKVTYMKPREK